jgi:hypothetical protein
MELWTAKIKIIGSAKIPKQLIKILYMSLISQSGKQLVGKKSSHTLFPAGAGSVPNNASITAVMLRDTIKNIPRSFDTGI